MSLSQVYSAIAGDTITAARWNNEFGNIYTNGTDVAFPLTKAVSYAGYTVTFDVAGVSTITSPATAGLILTIGSKSGTPGPNGNLVTVTASTFTDTATAVGATAALWAGFSIRTPTLAASAATVTTTEAATLYVEGGPTQGANETLTAAYAALFGGQVKVNDNVIIAKEDSRTTTVATPLTVRATTSGTPAAGIGTGVLFQAESQDESPSDIGQVEFALSDRTSGSEDSYFRILLRAAGAALSSAYKFVKTTAYQAIFTHSNTADRTYTLPDISCTLGHAGVQGPSSTGSGSTISHEGDTTISASQVLEGIHYYKNFTLDAGDTLTMSSGAQRLIIYATDTITINGTINTASGGAAGGTGTVGAAGSTGSSGFSQPGGGGGGNEGAAQTGGSGGGVFLHSMRLQAGGAGSTGVGTAGSTQSGASLQISSIDSICGGGGGGAGGGGTAAGATGGRGGGSIVLCAPTIILGAASALTTSGSSGGASDNSATANGAGGGGGAGNIYLFCQTYTDNGCVFTMSGGAGGADGGPGSAGGAGAAGVKQVNIYA